MEAKKKICDSCQLESYIWKNQSGIRYCKQCWSRHKLSIDKKPNTDKKIQLASAFLQYYYNKDPNILFDYELITDPEFISEANKFIGEKIFESSLELELYLYLASKSFIYG